MKSLTDKAENINLGVHCSLFSMYSSVGGDHSPFDNEIRAIEIAPETAVMCSNNFIHISYPIYVCYIKLRHTISSIPLLSKP